MQNFRDNSAPRAPNPTFISGIDGGVGASLYPPQSLELHGSSRIPEEYAGMQQQQHNSQTLNQHPHPMMPHHASQAALMQNYGARSRVSGETLQCDTKNSSSNNPYRKEMMDYYFLMNSKEGQRRGSQGLGYGTGLGFLNLDGQVPQQYRNARISSGPASGMSRYQIDYGGATLSGGSSSGNNSSSGTGAFSPSHQYSLSQNPSIQTTTGPQMHLRHQAQSYPSHQTHQGQQQRSYGFPGNRLPSPFSHYPPGSARMYSSPPQRYPGGRNSRSFECKINNSASAISNQISNSNSANPSNTVPFDSVGHSYSTSDYPFSPQPVHSHHRHPIQTHLNPQQNLGPSFETSQKMHPSSLLQQSGLPYSKQPSVSTSSSINLSIPQFPSQEMSKSPMHSQTQPPQFHQNFSPISNPSPVASVVQSPSYSSSPSPLMGVLEGPGNSAGPPAHQSSHPPLPKSRSSHSQNRLIQMMPQLSPTPNSNSSSSSLGSNSGNVNTAGLNTNSNHPQSRMGVGPVGGVNDEHQSSSIYPSSPLDKLILDPGTNSLNALTSQVANLPNTVQHMLLSDSVLSHKRGKDGGHQIQMSQSMHAMPTSQQRCRGISTACRTNTKREEAKRMNSGGSNSEGGVDEEHSQIVENPSEVGDKGDESFSEGRARRVKLLGGTGGTPEPISCCPPSHNQAIQPRVQRQTGINCQVSPSHVELGTSKRQTEPLTSPSVSTPEKTVFIPPSSSSSSSLTPTVEPSTIISPTCRSPVSFSVVTSPTPFPTLFSSAKPNCESGVSCIDPSDVLKESNLNERNKGIERSKEVTVEQKNANFYQKKSEGHDEEGAQARNVENEDEGDSEPTFKENEGEDTEKQKLQCSEDHNKNLNSKDARIAGGVGVIVSTRSEVTHPETGSEQSQTTVSTPQRDPDQFKTPGNEVTHTHSSLIDLRSYNGEGQQNLSTNPSHNGAKPLLKSNSENWVSPHHPHTGSQKCPYGYPELSHGSRINSKNSGRGEPHEGEMRTDFKYQGYHQPQPHYSPGMKKREGVEGQGRRGLGTGRGQDNNDQAQQPFPSLLQEVLQGYHIDKQYGHAENAVQFQNLNTHHQSPNYHHYSNYRNSQSMAEHLKPQTEMSIDHRTPTNSANAEKSQSHKKQSYDSEGVTTRKECSSDKNKILKSPSHTSPSIQQSADPSVLPNSKHINLADYSLPPRKPPLNLPPPSSAVEQLLLLETQQLTGPGASMRQNQFQNSSSSERQSVICDVSPSPRTTPERELARDKEREEGSCQVQVGCPEASVIQQSVSSTTVLDQGSRKQEEMKNEMKLGEGQQADKEAPNLKRFHSSNSPPKEIVVQYKNRHHSNTNLDFHNTSKQSKVNINLAHLSSRQPQQASQQSFSNPKPSSSMSSARFDSNFQGSDEFSHLTGAILEETGKGTSKNQSSHPHPPLSQQHHLPSLSQAENPQSTNKLQMYSLSHSFQYSHNSDDRFNWPASNNNQPLSKDTILSPGFDHSSSPLELKLQTSVLANQQPVSQPPPHGDYYNKMWGLSFPKKECEGTMGRDACQRNQQSAGAPESVPFPQDPSAGPKHTNSNCSQELAEGTVRSFLAVPKSNLHNQPDCSSNRSSINKNVSLGAFGKTRMGGSGDTNPLMMRRRVRSFISPIPAKRQHQDLSQQHQRGVSSQHSSLSPNCSFRHHVASDPSSPDAAHLKQAIPNSPSSIPTQNACFGAHSSALSKTKILPPRKGRGLKLEAIVQKITPNINKKPSINSCGNADSASDHMSSLSHTELVPYLSDTQDHQSLAEENFQRVGTGAGSCLAYLNDGLALDEIMSYGAVEETGPLHPTTYLCDPHQDSHLLKCDIMGNVTRVSVGDLEPELDFGMGIPGALKTERDSAGERVKDDLRIQPDFTLLGPLPPPPPLPRPVQDSPPPSSSALSDIQQFTTTYQQLETRRGEHTAATLLRQKLQESGMGLGLGNYAGRDYLETKSPHHNQNLGHCLLSNSTHPQMSHHHQHSLSQTQFEPKPENPVPKGYFPSGKKKGRPVGSVNKQKRAQTQPQNLPLNDPSVTCVPTPAPCATPKIEEQSSNSTTVLSADSPETSKTMPTLPAMPTSVSPNTLSQTEKMDIESEDTQPEIEVKPRRQRRRKMEEDVEGDREEVRQRRRRRGVVGVLDTEEMKAGIGIQETCGPSGIFSSYRKCVFAPYIHIERKVEDLGNVCTIVNAEDEKKKTESITEEKSGKWTSREMGGGTAYLLNLTATSQLVKRDKERERVKENKDLEKVDANLIQTSPTGKVMPSSGYLLSGPVTTEPSVLGHLLCCLCKKWANYKDLGDLYGPYYPPDYSTRLSKNPPVTRQSQGSTKASSTGVNLVTISAEPSKQDRPSTEVQTSTFTRESSPAGIQTTESLPAATPADTTPSEDGADVKYDPENNGKPSWELTQELKPVTESFKPEGKQHNLSLTLQNHQQQAEEIQKWPQHRKLTSHPRFKRRHKSSEDVPKIGPSSNKALLPFQPPPPLQLLNQDPSDPLAALSQLPQVPLDPEELWVHEGCIVWTSGVFLVNGRLYGLQEALDGARETCCSHCKAVGSTLGCYAKGCTLRYHYLCATEADCTLNEDNFSLRCPKHKFPQNSRPAKSVCTEQSERG